MEELISRLEDRLWKEVVVPLTEKWGEAWKACIVHEESMNIIKEELNNFKKIENGNNNN